MFGFSHNYVIHFFPDFLIPAPPIGPEKGITLLYVD
jgi:hypothetical protein